MGRAWTVVDADGYENELRLTSRSVCYDRIAHRPEDGVPGIEEPIADALSPIWAERVRYGFGEAVYREFVAAVNDILGDSTAAAERGAHERRRNAFMSLPLDASLIELANGPDRNAGYVSGDPWDVRSDSRLLHISDEQLTLRTGDSTVATVHVDGSPNFVLAHLDHFFLTAGNVPLMLAPDGTLSNPFASFAFNGWGTAYRVYRVFPGPNCVVYEFQSLEHNFSGFLRYEVGFGATGVSPQRIETPLAEQT